MIENMRLEGGELMFETLWSDMSKTWEPLCSFGEDGLKHESLQIFKRKNLKKWETLLKKAHIREPCSQTQEIKPTSSNSEPDIEYRVKMIKKMKFEEGELLFQTMWSDTSTTWEPLSSFGDEGLDHSSLQQFRTEQEDFIEVNGQQ
uniref:Chromo domain-containing protein n=1 Tax=Caenorhabditis tropicalis TaxID=1561998 RepID=A0A1I7TZ88_9PELO